MKRLIILVLVVSLLGMSAVVMAKPAGYNWKALIFVGTGMQYCEQRLLEFDKTACELALADDTGDADDKLVMKWSQAWQDSVFGPDGIRYNGDELPWTTDAWVNNEWNGMVPDGSGKTEHTKIVWVGAPCDDTNPNWRDGGECIWGSFEILHKQGKDSSGHNWDIHAKPAGYGGY